jgi:hypothetical protein
MTLIERLENLKSTRKQFGKGAELFSFIQENIQFKNEIVSLSKYFLNKTVGVGGCSNCVFDAYFELINLKEIIMETNYRLRAGVILRDVNGDSSKMMSNANLTDELAQYHLTSNPKCAKFFEKIPVKTVEKPVLVEEKPEKESEEIAVEAPKITRKKRK